MFTEQNECLIDKVNKLKTSLLWMPNCVQGNKKNNNKEFTSTKLDE